MKYEFEPAPVFRRDRKLGEVFAGPKRIHYHGEPLGRWNGDADERGEFIGLGDRELFREHLGVDMFACSSLCRSHVRVLRGLHYQPGLHKIVRCLLGQIVDVILDMRPESKTFGRYGCYTMEPFDGALYVPDGFAHGVYTVDRGPEYPLKGSVVLYSFSGPRRPELEGRVHPLDPDLDIPWAPSGTDFVLSEADRLAPTFAQLFPGVGVRE